MANLFIENEHQSNCASFITNIDTIGNTPLFTLALSYPSKFEVEAMTEFLQMKPEIETLTIGILRYTYRTCSRQ